MTTGLQGRYFLPGSARFVPALGRVDANETLQIESESGTILTAAPLRAVRSSPRLANLPRRFSLPSGDLFECDDNDAVDAFLRPHSSWRHTGLIDRLERSWHWAAVAIVVAALSAAGFVFYGIPYTANWLAQHTPASVDEIVTRETLRTLDATLLGPTELAVKDQNDALALFARVAEQGERGGDGYHLILRAAPAIGPNAFALPDGTVVLTDELWQLRENDAEIEGVFAHELSHVNRRHGLQAAYQAALVPAAIALVSGDPTQIAQMATLLPGILVQSAYSRGLEQQADDDAVAMLTHLGIDPSGLANILERVEAKVCEQGACAPSWLGTHPETASRAARLRGAPARESPP